MTRGQPALPFPRSAIPGRDVVGAFQHRPGGPPAGIDLGQRVQDGRRADTQPEPPGDQAQQVPGLQRAGPGEQPGQQVQLAALRAVSCLSR